MKKPFLAILFFLFGSAAWAQTEIGIKASGSIASNRVTVSDRYNFDKDGSKARFGLGLVIDYFFGENYALGTGLMYNTKGGSVKYATPDTSLVFKNDLNIQYLELPVTLKLFTNEVAPDVKIYFQLGGSLNTKLSAKVDDKRVINDEKTSKYFSRFEIGALAGAGAEWQLGQNTKVFGGFTYHRGLTNIDSKYKDVFKDISIKNNAVSLDLGLKF